MQKRQLLSFVLTAAVATSASAAGYQLQEYSITGLGRAFAGAGVMGDDYSAIAFNPAGMSLVDKSGIQMGAAAIDVYATARGESTSPSFMKGNVTTSDRTHTNIFRLIPHFYGQYKVNDKLDLGLGLYVPYGLASDYDDDWFGSVHGQYSGITSVDLTPSVSYKVLDNLAIGAGINFQYTVAHLTGGLVKGDGAYAGIYTGTSDMHGADDIGVGYNLGITWKPTNTTRLGLSYRSKIDHKLQGKNHVTLTSHYPAGYSDIDANYKVNAKITTPETIIFSAAQDINSKWTISGIARYTRWSRFDTLNIYQDGTKDPVSTTNENWKNTWFVGAGADYKYCKNLTFRFGTAWDNTAIRSSKYRTARIPDERRIWASIGASYTKNNWQVDVGYSHLFLHSAKAKGTTEEMRNTYGGSYNAKYHLRSDIVGIGVQYKF